MHTNIGISFSPYGHTYGRYGTDAFAQLKQHGYAAADYNLADTDSELYRLSEPDLTIKMHAVREAARLAGITVSQVHGPWHWPPTDNTAESRRERLEKMKRAVVISSLLGCENLVIHPIMPFGTEDVTCGKAEETWDMNVAFFTNLVDFAARYDVVICIENMPMLRFSLATPQRVLALVQAIDSDHCRVCLDTGHVAVFPDLSVGEEVRRVGRHLRVLHLHDNPGDRDAHLYPTHGVIDWADTLRALDEVGYTGVLSLETAPPGGLADDAFAEESVRLCQLMHNLVTQHKSLL